MKTGKDKFRGTNLQSVLRSATPLTAMILSFTLMYFAPQGNSYLWGIRMISGVVALIFIPGYCLAETFFRFDHLAEQFGFSFIFGLLVQNLIMYAMWSVGFLLYRQIDFGLAIFALSLFSVFVLCFLRGTKRSFKNESKTDTSSVDKKSWPFSSETMFLLLIFVISLTARLYFQTFSLYPSTDGSLYSEMARNLVTTGEFTSKTTYSGFFDPFYFELGFMPHPVAVFDIAIFFLFGGVSYSSAKLISVFAGSLIAFPVYGIAKKLYNKKAAMIASIITSFHPSLILMSSMVYGPEILGMLFMMTALYFLLKEVYSNGKSLKNVFFAGLFTFLAYLSWYPNNIVFIYFTVPIIFALSLFRKHGRKLRKTVLKEVLYMLILYAGFHAMFNVVSYLNSLWFIPVGVTIIFVYVLNKKRDDKWISNLCVFLMVFVLLHYLYLIRAYSFPQTWASAREAPVEEPLFGRYTSLLRLQIEKLSSMLSTFNAWWYFLITNSTPIITVLGILSFLKLSRLRENIILLSFPIFFSVAISLTIEGIDSTWLADLRLPASSVPFLIILSASALETLIQPNHLLQTGILRNTRKLRASSSWARFKYLIPAVFVSILVVSSFCAFFVPRYIDGLDFIHTQDSHKAWYDPYMDGCTFDWVKTNIPSEAILMARAHWEWAWYTDRAFVSAYPFTISEAEFYEVIQRFNVSYLIVDYEFFSSYSNAVLKNLYSNPSTSYCNSSSNSPNVSLLGPFHLILNVYNPSNGYKVIIYDVTDLRLQEKQVVAGWRDDSFTDGWRESRVVYGATGPANFSQGTDGDVWTLTRTLSDKTRGLWQFDKNVTVSTNEYPYFAVRWKSANMVASVAVHTSDDAFHFPVSGQSYGPEWTVTFYTLPSGKTVDFVRVIFDSNPDDVPSTQSYYLDYIMFFSTAT